MIICIGLMLAGHALVFNYEQKVLGFILYAAGIIGFEFIRKLDKEGW